MQTRRPLIAGNWKMFKTCDEAVATADRLITIAAGIDDMDIMIAPPFTALCQVAAKLRESVVAVGAQNMHWESEGAYTGEVSADMLLSCGCRYVLIGHSERRSYFGETDQSVNKKLAAAVRAGIEPILCIGETLSQREAGETFSVLDKQLQIGLGTLVSQDPRTLIVAYEPVWAIGTGKTATTEQAQEVHAHVRQWFTRSIGKGFAQALRIVYGGSVNPSNVKALMAMADVDGALVGGASLDPESFSRLIHYNKS